VSLGEAGLNPRGEILLSRNILYSTQMNIRVQSGQRINSAEVHNCRIAETGGFNRHGPKAKQKNLFILFSIREPLFRRQGLP
jgi:hypothetical protein